MPPHGPDIRGERIRELLTVEEQEPVLRRQDRRHRRAWRRVGDQRAHRLTRVGRESGDVRERAVELAPAERDALNAAFDLTHEVLPEHYRVAMASLDLVSDVAGDAPLLLVVEDAHWLDPPTADVLAFVARRIESGPVLLLTATRDGYPSALADAGPPEHRLAGLDDTTGAALLDAAAPGLPLTARNRVLREAAGNPLALLELPAVLGQHEDEASVLGGVPLTERLERAFAARVSDLADATRLVLLVAALNDGDGVDEILQAASSVAGTPLDLAR
jgi:hypothetical protein